ncbi:MAG: dedicator of cytokinesis-domain-containing protein, partial [Piptocephalis tieghemiana]
LSFVRDIDVEPLYLRYVHSLVQVQLRARNYTEAALSLIRLYADRLPWRVDGPKLPAAPGLGFPYAQSSFERRETLLLRALALATEGQAWELGMSIAKELAHQYAHTVYDYGRLAGMLRTEATLAERIVTQDRFPCVYFRVAYWGTGFPQGLRGRQYICRGRPWEQLGAFCERLQRRHPAARLLRSSGAPSEHVRQGGGGAQYVQVTVVTPEPDKPEALNILSKGDFVPPAIAAYWERNEVRKFSYSRPFRRLESSKLLDVWTERTTLHTEDTFPSVLRRAEVVRVEVRELSPLENAVEAVQERNRELRSMERKYGAHLVLGPDATEDDLGRVQGAVNCQPLTMTLNAAVNPAPHAGGAMMYREAFLSRRYVLAN